MKHLLAQMKVKVTFRGEYTRTTHGVQCEGLVEFLNCAGFGQRPSAPATYYTSFSWGLIKKWPRSVLSLFS